MKRGSMIFFLENAGELRIIILRSEKGKSRNNPTNTKHTHALMAHQLKNLYSPRENTQGDQKN